MASAYDGFSPFREAVKLLFESGGAVAATTYRNRKVFAGVELGALDWEVQILRAVR